MFIHDIHYCYHNNERNIFNIKMVKGRGYVKNKYLAITVIVMFSTIILIFTGCDIGMAKEMTFEVLSYEEAPDFVKNRIGEAEIIEESNKMYINLDEVHYIIIVPPEDKEVNVLYVGEDESIGHGLMYKYSYIDRGSEDILNNIKVIEINNHSGGIRGVLVKY